MTFSSRYVGNRYRLVNNYAQLECINDDTLDFIPFIKEGFKPKLHPLLLETTSFIITNVTKFTILTGIYNHRLSFNEDGLITHAEKHEVKPGQKLTIKVPTLSFNSEIQFYTIASSISDVNNNTYIPSSVDEYLPFFLTTEISENKTPIINLDFQNFERVTIECINSCTLNFATFLKKSIDNL
jgi:hypothetical protein